MNKAQLAATMRSTRTEFERLLAGIEPEQMTQRGVAGVWSVKDMLAHISWYQREEVELFGETGVVASPLWEVDQERRNELLFDQNRDRPLDDVLAEFRYEFERLLSLVERLSEEELTTPGRFAGTSAERPPWRVIATHSYEHDREHMEMIRGWLDLLHA